MPSYDIFSIGLRIKILKTFLLFSVIANFPAHLNNLSTMATTIQLWFKLGIGCTTDRHGRGIFEFDELIIIIRLRVGFPACPQF